MAATDDAFTVAPQPIVLSETVGEVSVPDYQAAVSRSGVVYLSLDVTGMHLPRTFKARALGYPLRFTNDEVVFYNTQGFMMQLLEEGMPGLFAIDAATRSPHSDTLQYSRHEFNTHFLQHAERQTHAVDAADEDWHQDGTPHINHDHLIVAMSGMLKDGSQPTPGATPAFELLLNTVSFFQHGLVGDAVVDVSGKTTIDSYDSRDGSSGVRGDIMGNRHVHIDSDVTVYGDVSGVELDVSGSVTGAVLQTTQPVQFLPVAIPTGLENLGRLEVKNRNTYILGPGSYRVSELIVGSDARLVIDNATGPVTLYVTKKVDISTKRGIDTVDPDPEKFAIYVKGDVDVKIQNDGTFYGVIHAPEALIDISGSGEFFGAFTGRKVLVSDEATVHYDTALRGQ